MPVFASRDEFVRDSRPGCRQAVWAELDPESITPARGLAAIRHRRLPFLLESASGPEKTGRYSFLGCEPFLVFRSKNDRTELLWNRDERVHVTSPGNPVHELRRLLAEQRMHRPAGLPPFFGGAVGYFSYDIKNFLERLPDTVEDDIGLPDCAFGFYDTIAVFDRYGPSLKVIATVLVKEDPWKAYREAEERIEQFVSAITADPGVTSQVYPPGARSSAIHLHPGPCPPQDPVPEGRHVLRQAGHAYPLAHPSPLQDKGAFFGPVRSTHDRASYELMVARTKEYIAAGDIYQANLSQRLSAPFKGDALELYEVLKQINPSPFAFFFDYEDFQIVSCSPERLIRLSGTRVDTRPIAGTRPRGRTESEDQAMARELILSSKERAEHVMIVDMSRNDIGRVCEYGSVLPDEFMILEPYSHVIHIVTNVTGRLREGCDALDLFSAVFPGASITGVPKIRCMEIIDELERVRRGPYTGSAGWISFAGDMDLNIIIRTFVIKNSTAYIQVGGGIVADSDPGAEYEETLHKGRALIEALEELAGKQRPRAVVA